MNIKEIINKVINDKIKIKSSDNESKKTNFKSLALRLKVMIVATRMDIFICDIALMVFILNIS